MNKYDTTRIASSFVMTGTSFALLLGSLRRSRKSCFKVAFSMGWNPVESKIMRTSVKDESGALVANARGYAYVLECLR